MNALERVTVYCGSSPGRAPAHVDTAVALGRLLGERGIGLVYGGGRVGLMGALADATLAAGGSVTGVITRHLLGKEVGHDGLSELLVVESMHERKLAMADRADGFVALPGGFGTLEELFEMITWSQLGIHTKPIGVLDPTGFYDPLLAFLDNAVDDRFIRPAHRAAVLRHTDPAALLAAMAAWEPADTTKWLDLDQR